jgi:hypothetical protein
MYEMHVRTTEGSARLFGEEYVLVGGGGKKKGVLGWLNCAVRVLVQHVHDNG